MKFDRHYSTVTIAMKNPLIRVASVLAIFGGLALGVGLADEPTPAQKHKPLNVLFIISDDMRAELSCYGGMAKTPNIDALARAGIRFDRAYCQYPLCNPSRSSLLTGRYPVTTGVLGNRTWFGDLHPDFISLPKWFKQHDFVTMRAGKIFHGGIDDTEAWTEGGEARLYGGNNNPEAQKVAPLPAADPDETFPLDDKKGSANKADDTKKTEGKKAGGKGKKGAADARRRHAPSNQIAGSCCPVTARIMAIRARRTAPSSICTRRKKKASRFSSPAVSSSRTVHRQPRRSFTICTMSTKFRCPSISRRDQRCLRDSRAFPFARGMPTCSLAAMLHPKKLGR